MDVRCDRCQTEYELDEMRLTASGVAVKCTNCGNVFKVRRNLGDDIVPAKQKVREWHVRRQDGTTLTLRELTDLQKAVVERQVAPEDSVSLSGESWHQLGSMPELASFFEVVQAANQSRQAQVAAQRAPTVPARTAPTQMSPPTPTPTPESSLGRSRPPQPAADIGLGRSPTPMWGDGPQSLGAAPVAAEPAWATSTAGRPNDPELTALLEKEDLQAVKSGGSGLWIALVVLLLAAGGGGGYYYFFLHGGGSAPGTIAVAPPKPPDVNAQYPAPPPEVKPEEPKPPTAPTTVAANPAAPGSAPAAAPGPAPVAAPAATPPTVAAAKPEAKPPEKPAKPAAKPKPSDKSDDEGSAQTPSGKSFDYYISQAHKLLDSKPTQALALFQKAAEVDPRSPEPDSGRGLAYANMDRLGEAASAFQAALKKSPEFTEAIMGLAEVSRAQGNARKAIGLYQRYLDLTPDGTDAPAARAQLERLKSEVAAQTSPPAPASAVVATPVTSAPTPAPVSAPPPVEAPAPAEKAPAPPAETAPPPASP